MVTKQCNHYYHYYNYRKSNCLDHMKTSHFCLWEIYFQRMNNRIYEFIFKYVEGLFVKKFLKIELEIISYLLKPPSCCSY